MSGATVYTFYSYKGGVGRSMALANIATWFTDLGVRVVVVDWDLEAPGLESFLVGTEEEREVVRGRIGLIDLLLAYKAQYPHLGIPGSMPTEEAVGILETELAPLDPLLHRIEPEGAEPGAHPGALWLLPPGRRAGDRFATYAEAVQSFNWNEFYSVYHGQAYFEWFRRTLCQPTLADAVFIDSRTGVTEMGGVCTQQMADVVVGFCAPNNQNVSGVHRMATSFQRPEILAARGGRPPIDFVAVPSRIEATEIQKRHEFRDLFERLLNPFIPAALKTVNPTFSFWDLQIPYIAKYSYEESVIVGAPDAAEEMDAAYRNLGNHLARLDSSRVLPRGLTGLDATVGEPTIPLAVWNVPRSARTVVGRKDELARLAEMLPREGPGLVAICGLPGVGKSALALQFAQDHRGEYDIVWWVNASDGASCAAGLGQLAGAVGLPPSAGSDIAGPTEYALRWLSQNSRWLLVFDKAPDPDTVLPFIPTGDRGHVIVTSRTNVWRKLGKVFHLEVLAHDAATELVAQRTGDPDRAAAGEVARSLGGLPLALELAGAYVEQTGRSYDDLMQILRDQPGVVLAGEPKGMSSLSDAWADSFVELAASSNTATDLLYLLAFLEADDIPFELIANGAPLLSGPLAELSGIVAMDDAVAQLSRLSLVRARGSALNVPRIIQLVTRDRLSPEQHERFATAAVTVTNQSFPADGEDLRTWATCARMLPHALAATGHAARVGAAPQIAGELLTRAGSYLLARGDLGKAQDLLQQAVSLNASIAQAGADQAKALMLLGRVLIDLGKPGEAYSHLTLAREYVGVGEPGLFTKLLDSELARVKVQVEGWDALEKAPIVLGPGDAGEPSGFRRLLRNVADVLLIAGRAEQARDLIDELANVRESDDPAMLPLTTTYAQALFALGDFDGSRRVLVETVDRSIDVYGALHPAIGEARMLLGSVAVSQGDEIVARENWEAAFMSFSSVFGPEYDRTRELSRLLRRLEKEMGHLEE